MKPNCGRWNSRRRRPPSACASPRRRWRALQQRDAQRAAADAARLALTAAQAQADRRDLEQQLRQLDADTERLDGALKAADELIAGDRRSGRGGWHRSAGRRSAGLRGSKASGPACAPSCRPWPRGCRTGGAGRAGAAGRPRTGGRRATAVDGGGGAGTARRGPAAHRAGRQDLPALQRELAALDAEGRRCWPAWARPASMRSSAPCPPCRAQGDLEGMRRALQIHAPKGIDMLRGQRDEALARRDASASACRRRRRGPDLASARRALARRRLPPNTRAMPGPSPARGGRGGNPRPDAAIAGHGQPDRAAVARARRAAAGASRAAGRDAQPS